MAKPRPWFAMLVWCSALTPLVATGAESTLSLTPTSGAANWFNAALWSNGVPNAAGDVATISYPTVGRSGVSVNLSSPVTVDSLLGNAAGPYLISGQALTFSDGVAGDTLLRNRRVGNSTLAADSLLTIRSPISVVGGPLAVDAGERAPIRLEGALTSSATVSFRGNVTLAVASPNLTGPVVVESGELVVTTAQGLGQPAGATTVASGARLALRTASSSEAFELAGGTLTTEATAFSGPVLLSADSRFVASGAATTAGMELTSGFTGPGGLTLAFSGARVNATQIRGASNYLGRTVIESGNYTTLSPTSLGSDAGDTVVRGGTLTIGASSRERFSVEGGSLTFSDGAIPAQPSIPVRTGELSVVAVQSAVGITIDNAGGGVAATYSQRSPNVTRASWTGGSSGRGDLVVSGRVNVDAPLTHDGGTTFRDVTLNVANTYTGPTRVAQGEVTVNDSGAFGSASSPVVVDRSTLRWVAPGSLTRDVDVQQGTLHVSDASAPVTGNIRLGGSSSSLTGSVYAGEVVVLPGATNTTISNAVLNGPLRGSGQLAFTGGVVLNAPGDFRGVLESRGAVANHPEAVRVETLNLSSGDTALNFAAPRQPTFAGILTSSSEAPRLILGADQQTDHAWLVSAGSLRADRQATFRDLVLVAGVGGASTLETGPNGSIRLDGELVAFGSTNRLTGTLTGGGDVRNRGFQMTVSSDLRGFRGDLYADTGELFLQNPDQMNPSTAIHVSSGGRVSTTDGEALANDVHLWGDSTQPAQVSVAGDQLGDVYFHGANSVMAVRGKMRGRIFGEDVTVGGVGLNGPTGSVIASPQLELKGNLRVAQGNGLLLEGGGALSAVKEVLLTSGSSLSIASGGSTTDRISDAAVIRSHGTQIVHTPALETNGAPEWLGTLVAERGLTQVNAAAETVASANALTFRRLERSQGAAVRLRASTTGVPKVVVDDVATFDGRMIGGWASAEVGSGEVMLAAVNAAGWVVPVEPTVTSLSLAGPTDHVMLTAGGSLSSDTVVASLTMRGNELDLAGRTLRVTSGGVVARFSGALRNGRITSGTGSGPSELVIHTAGDVAASVVDGPGGAPVSLILPDGGRLTGANTYTGGTRVLGGRVTLSNPSTIPAQDRLTVDGGHYDVAFTTPSTPIAYESISVRSGRFTGPSLTANRIDVESGTLSAGLVGDFEVVKRGPGLASVTAGHWTLESFTGAFRVLEGVLRLDARGASNAEAIVEGGILYLDSPFAGPRDGSTITLAGGAFRGGHLGPVRVTAPSVVLTGTNFSGPLTGNADLTVRQAFGSFEDEVALLGDNPDFRGRVDVESGLLSVATPRALGSGSVTIQEGGALTLGQFAGPALTIANAIHLRGGAVFLRGGSFGDPVGTSVLAGEVTVDGRGYLHTGGRNSSDTLAVAGRLVLNDGASIFGAQNRSVRSAGRIELRNDLVVGADTSWTPLLTTVVVGGRVVASSSDSSIDFRGAPERIRLSGATLVTEAGKRLAVTVNGGRDVVSLVGTTAGIRGSGTIAGRFSVAGGAVLNPGDAPSVLGVDGDLAIGDGAIYEWRAGARGAHLLDVAGELDLSTVTSGWTLRLMELGPAFTLGQQWTIAQAGRLVGLNPTRITVDTSRVGLAPGAFVVSQVNQSMVVTYVPEPGTAWLLSLAFAARGRRRGKRD